MRYFHDGLFCSILLRLDITLVITQKYDQAETYDLSLLSTDDSAKGGLTQFWELFTMILCAPKYLKR